MDVPRQSLELVFCREFCRDSGRENTHRHAAAAQEPKAAFYMGDMYRSKTSKDTLSQHQSGN